MNKYVVTVTEVYHKEIEVEAPDAETAEALVRGQWDQGEHDLASEKDCFDHVEIYADAAESVMEGREHGRKG